MAFSINEFTSKIHRYGLTKSNLFHVQITTPICLRDDYSTDFYTRDLQFFCRTAEVPDMNVDTTPVFTQGTGVASHRPNGFTFSPFNTVFMVDSEFRVKHFFHRWMQCIYNFNNDNPLSEVNGALPYEIGYANEYKTTVTVTQFSTNSEDDFYTYNFYNAFPRTIGTISSQWEDQNTLMTLPVSWNYDNMAVLGATPGQGMSSRATNQSRIISEMALDNISQFRTILDIQNAVDRITTVSKSIKRIF